MGKRVAAPFQLPPRLRDCRIRRSDAPDPQLQKLAKDAILQARRITTAHSKQPSTGTTFVTLPRELRLRILEYTDLITPWREVSWSRSRPECLVPEPLCRLLEFGICRFPNHSGCKFVRCWNTPYPQVGCFYCSLHSAFSSSWYVRPHLFTPPLFLQPPFLAVSETVVLLRWRGCF